LRRRADRDGAQFWDEITLPGYKHIIAEIAPGKPTENMRIASSSSATTRASRPTQCHGIDLVTDNPHISAEHVKGEEIDMVLSRHDHHGGAKPITPDGNFGIFLGPHFIVTNTGHEVVDTVPARDRGRERVEHDPESGNRFRKRSCQTKS